MNCKTAILIAGTALSSMLAVACQTSPSMTNNDTGPSITTTANRRQIMAGESVRLSTTTMNLAGSKAIKWSVSPNAAGVKVTPDKDMDNKTALFTADQPGVYVVHADADTGGGHWVTSQTSITVDARPGTISSDH